MEGEPRDRALPADGGAGLLLVGHRVVPPWTVPAGMADPLLPERVVTVSSDLVDAVPDDGAWFASAAAAAPFVTRGSHLVAVGVREQDADVVVEHELAQDTSRLRLEGQFRTAWPADLAVTGYEVIGLEPGGFHSWLCYGGAASWAFRELGVRPGAHGLIGRRADAVRVAEAAEADGSGLPPVPWVAVALGLRS